MHYGVTDTNVHLVYEIAYLESGRDEVLNGMTLLDISEYWQFVVRGILIPGAVLINSIQAQRVTRPVSE